MTIATGKHVVRMLLDKGDTTVVAVTRSSARLLGLLNTTDDTDDNLMVREIASLSDLTETDLSELTDGCTAIVSCLGHNLTFRGMYKDGQFLTQIVRKLTAAMPSGCRFILMGSDGVSHDGDAPRSRAERTILWLLRYLVPPHADNEGAARCLRESPSSLKYCVARPGDLTDDETDAKGYEVLDHPRGSLFGGDSTSRMQVADCLVDLATMDPAVFDAKRNRTMPVVYSIPKEEEDGGGGKKTN